MATSSMAAHFRQPGGLPLNACSILTGCRAHYYYCPWYMPPQTASERDTLLVWFKHLYLLHLSTSFSIHATQAIAWDSLIHDLLTAVVTFCRCHLQFGSTWLEDLLPLVTFRVESTLPVAFPPFARRTQARLSVCGGRRATTRPDVAPYHLHLPNTSSGGGVPFTISLLPATFHWLPRLQDTTSP